MAMMEDLAFIQSLVASHSEPRGDGAEGSSGSEEEEGGSSSSRCTAHTGCLRWLFLHLLLCRFCLLLFL